MREDSDPRPVAMSTAVIRIVPFDPRHLLLIDMGVSDRTVLGGFDRARCAAGWPPGPALSAVITGRVLGCAGLMAQGETAIAWAVLSDELRRRPFPLHRAALRALNHWALRFTRIRTTVAYGFTAGHRWVLALGFRFSRVLPAYGPSGETFMEYER